MQIKTRVTKQPAVNLQPLFTSLKDGNSYWDFDGGHIPFRLSSFGCEARAEIEDWLLLLLVAQLIEARRVRGQAGFSFSSLFGSFHVLSIENVKA